MSRIRLLALAFAALFLAPGLSSAEDGVRIWIRVPSTATPQALEAVALSQTVVTQLLGPGILAEHSESGSGASALRYWSRTWREETPAERRTELVNLLKALWGDDLVIQDPAPRQAAAWVWTPPAETEASKSRLERSILDYQAMSKVISDALPEGLASGGRERFYDGSRRSKEAGVVAPAPVAVPVSEARPWPAKLRRRAGPFESIIREEAASAQVPTEVVRSVIAAKSGFRPHRSGGGAYGLMLVSPASAEAVGVSGDELLDPRMNIRAGSRILGRHLKRFNNDLKRALAAYQAGAGRARKDDVYERKDVDMFLKAFYAHYRPDVPEVHTVPKEPPPRPRAHASTPFESSIQREAADAGVDPDIVRAVVAAKSGFNPKRSGGGAYGLMLISPGAASMVGEKGADLMDPDVNIRVGSKLIARLLKQFGGDIHRALAAYQVGVGAVRRSGGIPNRADVRAFLANYEKAYRQLSPEPSSVSPVSPPRFPLVREFGDLVKGFVYKDPKDAVARYRPMIEKYAAKHKVDPRLVEAIMRRENVWGDPSRVSDAGAVGLMQLMPDTAAWLGVDPHDVEQNVEGGVRQIKFLLTRFEGNRVLAVAAYNAGHGPVEKYGRIPNYRETVKFVVEVFNNYYDLTGEMVDYSGHLSERAKKWAKGHQAVRQRARDWD